MNTFRTLQKPVPFDQGDAAERRSGFLSQIGSSKHLLASRLAAVCFALFVFAGYYKAADFLKPAPIDLTLLFWIASLGFCLAFLWRDRCLPMVSVALAAVFLALAMGLHWPESFSDYAGQKEIRLFTLTAVAAFAPLILLRDTVSRNTFFWVVGLLGMIMAAIAAYEVIASGFSFRAQVFNTNPILLARASGFATLILCLAFWHGRIKLVTFVTAMTVVVLGLLVSGTRGPLVALVVALASALPLCAMTSESRRRVWGTVIACLAGFAGIIVFLAIERPRIGQRFVRLIEGEWGHTEISRWALWQQSLEVIRESPLGVGWGRLSNWVQVYNDDILLRHSHNIFLEIASEAGWPAGMLFLLFIVLTLAALLRTFLREIDGSDRSAARETVFVLAALVYWLLCAFFSGDVNDNRPLWALIGMALALRPGRTLHLDAFRRGGSGGG